jgi:DNA-binding XRE family transcriptional regulator
MSREKSAPPKGEVKHRGPKSEHPEPKVGSLPWKIRQKRRKDGLSTGDLGKKIGVSGVSISKIETGRTHISESTMWTVIKIVQALNTDFNEPVVREHLQEWIPRLDDVWRIVEYGPHDFGKPEQDTAEYPPMPPQTRSRSMHAGLVGTGGTKGEPVNINEEEMKDFHAVIQHARTDQKRRGVSAKVSKKRGGK